MKKFINPSAILYILVLVLITGLIGYAAGGKKSNSEGVKVNNINKMINAKNEVVVLETSMGNIELELYPSQAPKTVANFLKLAKANFYDMTKFHRVIKGFMIQGGDPYSKGEDTSYYGTGGPGYQFADEPNDLPLVRGTLAMANSGPNTNGSQFFIITAQATPWLTGKHTAFGKVISGMEVVDKIESVRTDEEYNRPLTPVILTKVSVK